MIAQDTGIYKLRTVSAALPSSSTERKDDAEVESAALSAVTCQWSATDLEGEANVLNITTRGSYTAVGSSVCNFGGNVTYRPSGKNVYNVTLTFGGAPCMLPGGSLRGLRWLLHLRGLQPASGHCC